MPVAWTLKGTVMYRTGLHISEKKWKQISHMGAMRPAWSVQPRGLPWKNRSTLCMVCSFAMSVFPILPWFVSTLCLNYLVFLWPHVLVFLIFPLFLLLCVYVYLITCTHVMSACYVLQRRCEKWCATVMRDYYCVIVTKLGIFFLKPCLFKSLWVWSFFFFFFVSYL